MYAVTNNLVDVVIPVALLWAAVVVAFVLQRRHYHQWKAPFQDYSYSSRKALEDTFCSIHGEDHAWGQCHPQVGRQDRGSSHLNVLFAVMVVSTMLAVMAQKLGAETKELHCDSAEVITQEEC